MWKRLNYQKPDFRISIWSMESHYLISGKNSFGHWPFSCIRFLATQVIPSKAPPQVDQDKVSADAPAPKDITVNVPACPKAMVVGSQDWWAKSWWILAFYINILYRISKLMVVGFLISQMPTPGSFLYIILDCNL